MYSEGSETGVKRLGLRIIISEIKIWKTENQNEYENRNETGEDTYARFAPLAQAPPLSFLFSYSF